MEEDLRDARATEDRIVKTATNNARTDRIFGVASGAEDASTALTGEIEVKEAKAQSEASRLSR